MHNPLQAIVDIKPSERPKTVLMFAYFFLVITSFWVLKPIKKSLLIGHYKEAGGFELLGTVYSGSQAELFAKVLNMLVAYGAVVVFSAIASRLKRERLTAVLTAFFMVSYLVYSWLLISPGAFTVWTFYLFGDLFSTVMVTAFFAFLNDIVTPDAAKRTYGLIGTGGVLGGVFGTTVVRGGIDSLSVSAWMWVCLGLAALILIIAVWVGRLVSSGEAPAGSTRRGEASGASKHALAAVQAESAAVEKGGGNPALDGARLVFRSGYLLAVVGMVALYEVLSTIMDFQFSSTIEHFSANREEIGLNFASAFQITNVVALLVQLLLTSFIMKRFGVGRALMVLPVTMFLGSVGFLVLPVLSVGKLLNTADNGFSYSIHQSAKESLYVPTTDEEKYKAKAFIDMFVQRFAKAVAVGISLGVTAMVAHFSAVRWLGLISVVLCLALFLLARYAGRRFDQLASEG